MPNEHTNDPNGTQTDEVVSDYIRGLRSDGFDNEDILGALELLRTFRSSIA